MCLFLVRYRSKLYGGYRQVVKTSDCGSDMRGFESHYPPHNKNKHPLWVRFLFVSGMRTLPSEAWSGFERKPSRGRSRFCLWQLPHKAKCEDPFNARRSKTIPLPAPFKEFDPSGSFLLGTIRVSMVRIYFFRTVIIRLKCLFLPQSAVCKGFGGRK